MLADFPFHCGPAGEIPALPLQQKVATRIQGVGRTLVLSANRSEALGAKSSLIKEFRFDYR